MNKDQIIEWLNNEVMRNQIYHDHKENMMWASFALFLSGAVATMLWLNGVVAIINKDWLISGILIATLITIVFVLWQFVNRVKAGNKIDAIILTTIDLFKSAQKHLDWNVDKKQMLPRFVVENAKKKRAIDRILRILLNLVILLVPILVACIALITIVSNK